MNVEFKGAIFEKYESNVQIIHFQKGLLFTPIWKYNKLRRIYITDYNTEKCIYIDLCSNLLDIRFACNIAKYSYSINRECTLVWNKTNAIIY